MSQESLDEQLFYECRKYPDEHSLGRVKELVQQGASVNWQNGYDLNNTALMYSCDSNHVETVRFLLLAQTDINVNLVNEFGQSAFYCACAHGNNETVQILVQDARVNVRLSDNRNWSPLMWAAYYGYTETLKRVIVSGRMDTQHAQQKSTEYLYENEIKAGSTALDIARQRREEEEPPPLEKIHNKIESAMEEYLAGPHDSVHSWRQELNLPELTNKEKFLFACADGEIEQVKQFLSKGQDVNAIDHTDSVHSVYHNQTEIVKLLLQQPNIKEDSKNDP